MLKCCKSGARSLADHGKSQGSRFPSLFAKSGNIETLSPVDLENGPWTEDSPQRRPGSREKILGCRSTLICSPLTAYLPCHRQADPERRSLPRLTLNLNATPVRFDDHFRLKHSYTKSFFLCRPEWSKQ